MSHVNACQCIEVPVSPFAEHSAYSAAGGGSVSGGSLQGKPIQTCHAVSKCSEYSDLLGCLGRDGCLLACLTSLAVNTAR